MKYKDLNDYEIFYRIRENDEMAINELFEKYEPVIIGIVKKYYLFAKKFGIEIEDLIQEGRIAVNKAIRAYNVDGNNLFYTYVTICIERQMISFCRNISRIKRLSVVNHVDDECLYFIGDMSFEPSSYVLDKYAEEQFIKYKNKFEIEDSSIFELRYNGFSYKEISRLLDIPVSYVDSRLCKIRRTLQGIRNKF